MCQARLTQSVARAALLACRATDLAGEICCGVGRRGEEDAVGCGGIALLHLRQHPQHLQHAVHVAAVP